MARMLQFPGYIFSHAELLKGREIWVTFVFYFNIAGRAGKSLIGKRPRRIQTVDWPFLIFNSPLFFKNIMTRTGQRAPKLKFFRGSTHGNTRRVSKEQPQRLIRLYVVSWRPSRYLSQKANP